MAKKITLITQQIADCAIPIMSTEQSRLETPILFIYVTCATYVFTKSRSPFITASSSELSASFPYVSRVHKYVGRWVGTVHADSLVQVHTLLISLHALLSQLVLTSTYVRTCVFSRHVHSKVGT